MLVLFDGWTSFFRDKVVPWRIGMAEKLRTQLETQVLPRFIETQRWYAAKGEPIEARRDRRPRRSGTSAALSWLLAFIEVKDSLYFLPLALGLGRRGGAACSALVARQRSRACASRPTSACWPTRSPTRASAGTW